MAGTYEMTGAQRAAAFLLSLDKEAAANVIKHIDERVIVEIVEAMGRLEASMGAPETVRLLEKELIRTIRKPRGARIRSDDELRTMLEQTLGQEQASLLFAKIQQRLLHERPFIALEKEPPENIAKLLAEESDAVASLVLTHLDPSLSADVLGILPAPRAIRLVHSMASLVPPSWETLVLIADDLMRRLVVLAAAPALRDPVLQLRSIAEMLNYSRPDVEQTVLEGLDHADADMAATIREFMFTWDDLADLDKRAMQKVLASIDTHTLSIALKGAHPSVEDNLMGNLSQRVRLMIREEREMAGAMPLVEVQAARAEVMRAVRGLMEAGEFRPARAGDELVD
jgi:flagellar motor switch protein FliG